MSPQHREEAASLYVLGLLDVGERVSFELEMRREPALLRRVDRLKETTSRLAHLAPPAAPSAFLRERVLESVSARQASAAPIPSARPKSGSRRMQPWAVAAGFAFLAAAAGWQNLQLREQVGGLQLAQQEAESARDQLHNDAGLVIAELRRQMDVAELKVASLASLLRDNPQAQAVAFWNPLTQEGVLTVVNLPGLETDRDYQLWLIDPQYDIPVDGGVFRVDAATGEARVRFRPDRPIRNVDAFAVSLERAGGVPKAEGPMVLLSR
jgi:anti-sigma-K factor RskA